MIRHQLYSIWARTGAVTAIEQVKRDTGWVFEQPWYETANAKMQEVDVRQNQVAYDLNVRQTAPPAQTLDQFVSNLVPASVDWSHPWADFNVYNTGAEFAGICRGYNRTEGKQSVYAIPRDDTTEIWEFWNNDDMTIGFTSHAVNTPVGNTKPVACCADENAIYILYSTTSGATNAVVAKFPTNPWVANAEWYYVSTTAIQSEEGYQSIIVADTSTLAFLTSVGGDVGLFAFLTKDGSTFTVANGNGDGAADEFNLEHNFICSNGTHVFTINDRSTHPKTIISSKISAPTTSDFARDALPDSIDYKAMCHDGRRIMILSDDGRIYSKRLYPVDAYTDEYPYLIGRTAGALALEFDGTRNWALTREDDTGTNKGLALTPINAAGMHDLISAGTSIMQSQKIFVDYDVSNPSTLIPRRSKLVYSDGCLWILPGMDNIGDPALTVILRIPNIHRF